MEVSTLFDVNFVLLSLVVFLLAYLTVRFFISRDRHRPPGPPVWPLLGSIPYFIGLGAHPLQLAIKLAQTFGDIVHLRLVGFDVIVLNDYQIIKEAFHRTDFSARPQPIYSSVAKRPNFGLVSSSGNVSKEQRQLAHSFFRTMGVGKRRFEEQIVLETSYLMEEFRKTQSKPFDPKVMINNAVSNVICSVVFGSRHEYTDPTFNALLDSVNSNLQISKSGGLFFFMHSIAWIPYSPGYKIRQNVRSVISTMKRFLDAHLKDHIPGEPRDMIDMYIDKINDLKQSGKQSSYDETNLLFSLADTFSGGSETNTTALRWLLLRMISHPDVQTKVQAEIDEVVGRERLPTLLDQSNMPYTQATILENFRTGFITPLGVPHQYTGRGDLSFHGYHIPEGALIVPNNWWLCHDPKHWEDPEMFRPERHLNEEGKLVKSEEIMPFSIGKRVCIGESLARMEIFIVFSQLLHQFNFKLPDDVTSFPLHGTMGAVYMPEPYQLCAISRM